MGLPDKKGFNPLPYAAEPTDLLNRGKEYLRDVADPFTATQRRLEAIPQRTEGPTGDKPPQYPYVPTDPGSIGEGMEGMGLSDDVARFIYGDDTLPFRPQQVIVPAREDYNVPGRENYEQATKVQPEKAASAVMEAGQAKAGAGQQLGDFYTAERGRQEQAQSVMRAQQLRDQQEYEARVRQLDSASDAIARHRLDQGRFFKSPGNIIAALGAAVMQLGTNEPIGVKLISGAIDRDLQVQRAEHDFLQADKQGLETNVGLFRQLAGDKQAGDLLHEAKMRETAALKVQEIGAQLQSKEAVASAKAISAQLLQQAAQMRMNAHAQLVYRAPSVTSPAMRGALMTGDVQAFPQVDPQTGAPVPQAAATQGAAVMQGGNPAAGPAQGMTQGMQRSGLATEARFAQLSKQVEDRLGIPGAGVRMMEWRNDVRRRAVQQGHVPGTPAYYKFLDDERVTATKNAAEPAKALLGGKLLPAYHGVTALQREMARLDQEVGNVDKIDQLLGQNWKMAGGDDLVAKIRRAKEAFGWTDDQAIAARRFAQTLQHASNAYTKATAGGTVTGGEQERLWREVQTSGSYDSIRHWANLVSEGFGSELAAAIRTSPDHVGQYLAMLELGIRPTSLPVAGTRNSRPEGRTERNPTIGPPR